VGAPVDAETSARADEGTVVALGPGTSAVSGDVTLMLAGGLRAGSSARLSRAQPPDAATEDAAERVQTKAGRCLC